MNFIFLAVFTLAVILSGCDASRSGQQDRQPLSLPLDAQALHWFDDNSLLVSSAGSLWVFDAQQDTVVREFPSPDPSLVFLEARRISDRAAILMFGPLSTLESGRGDRLLYSFPEWPNPARHDLVEHSGWRILNSLDCSTYSGREAMQNTLLIGGRERRQETGFPQLLPSSQG
ncbi:hypothetical protein BH23GEM9_BH23GEM9_33010 [soil metagenome]